MSSLTFVFRYYAVDWNLDRTNNESFAADPDSTERQYTFRREGTQLWLNEQSLTLKEKVEYSPDELSMYNDIEDDTRSDEENVFKSSLQYAIQDVLSEEESEDFYSMAPIISTFEMVMWKFVNGDAEMQDITVLVDNQHHVKIGDHEWNSVPSTGNGMDGWDPELLLEN